jgi:hypothetical protein
MEVTMTMQTDTLTDAQLDDVSGGATLLETVFGVAALTTGMAIGVEMKQAAGSNAAQGAARGILAGAAG